MSVEVRFQLQPSSLIQSDSCGTIVDDDALFLLTQPVSQRAPALDSVLFTKETLPISEIL